MAGKLRFRGDANVCSLTWLRGFGERCPSGHSKTVYDDYGTIGDGSLLAFAVDMETAIKEADRGPFGTPWSNNAFIIANVLSTQPLAVKHMTSLGFTAHGPEGYKKYNHDMTIFTSTPEALIKAVQLVISEAKEAAAAKNTTV